MTRQEAARWLEEMLPTFKEGSQEWEVTTMAIEALKDDWIPVSKELPKESGKYFASVSGYFDFVSEFDYDAKERMWYDPTEKNRSWNKYIIAWRHIPKPYRSLYNKNTYNDNVGRSYPHWRVGGICSKCGYDITPDLDWGEEAPEYCPECQSKMR